MSEVTFQRLFPDPELGVTAESHVAAVITAAIRPARRPLVLSNFVTSLDGNATFHGGSTDLSDQGDRRLFHALRDSAGAIMAGTGTLAAERYRPAGKPVVTITRSGNLPLDIPLFSDPAGEAIVFTDATPDLSGVAARVTLEPLGDPAAMLECLSSAHDIEVLLCEGGPSLLGELIRANLVDELFLTLAAKLAGGDAGPNMTSGDPAEELVPMTLTGVLEWASTLYLHYSRPR